MKITEDRINIIKWLKSQAPSFVPYNVIGIIENENHPVYFDAEKGAVWAQNQYFNYVSGDSETLVAHLETLEDGFYGFAAVEGSLAETLMADHFIHWYEPTERYVHQGEIPKGDASPYPLCSVPIEEAKGIDDRYEFQQEGSFEKLVQAINNRPSSAMYLDGELASYALVHEDNSIGYMYTLEKHRHRGLGYWVALDILKKMREAGHVAFVEIHNNNIKSQGLAQKVGLIKDAYTPWFGIIKGVPEWFKTWNPLGGASYHFTSLAQLKYGHGLSCEYDVYTFEKQDKGYIAQACYKDKKTTFRMTLDETNEAYLIQIDEIIGFDMVDLAKIIAGHFPDKNASFIFPYDPEMANGIKGIVIQKED